ncbi:MAG: hypothetical protein WCO86_14685 [Planctomycetota bacterium]|jgi:hypothetical protein
MISIVARASIWKTCRGASIDTLTVFVLGQVSDEVPAMFFFVCKRRDAEVLRDIVTAVAQSDQLVVLSDR